MFLYSKTGGKNGNFPIDKSFCDRFHLENQSVLDGKWRNGFCLINAMNQSVVDRASTHNYLPHPWLMGKIRRKTSITVKMAKTVNK